MRTVIANAIFHEYIPFIVLLFSLYVISGGIRIEGDLQANPMTNATNARYASVFPPPVGNHNKSHFRRS